jgi:hypothetical protein
VAQPVQHPFHQLPGESIKAYQAFVVYRNLDPKERSLQRVGSELVKSRQLLSRWSAKWGWVERTEAWDNFQEIKRLEKRIEEKQKMDEQHLKIVRAMRSKIIEALTKADPEVLAVDMREMRSWIRDFIKLERLIMGEPESIEERREKIEIHASIEEQIKEYAPVFQELIDEGIITLDGHPRAQIGAASDADDEADDDEGPPVFIE